MRSDDRAQMMLLAAVVLVVAFLSLSVLVGRIATIEPETQREAGSGLTERTEPVRRAACAAMEATSTVVALDVALDYLEVQLAGRGVFSTLSAVLLTEVTIALRDSGSTITFTVTEASDC